MFTVQFTLFEVLFYMYTSMMLILMMIIIAVTGMFK